MPTYSDEPSADAGALPVWFLSQMTRQPTATVALSGEGADEIFGGYVTYVADKLSHPARMLPATVRRIGASVAGWLPVSDEKISLEYKMKRFLEGSLLDRDMAHIYWNGTFSEREKRNVFRHSDPGPLRGLFDGAPAHQRNFWYDQSYYLPDDILYKVDRMSMAHSLEVRPPFLDHRVVEFGASLPEDFKVNGFQKKFLLRHLMRNKLPESVLSRPKQGLDIPIHDWFRGPLQDLLLDTLTDGALKRSGLFYPTKVWSLVRSHLERRANVGYHLWGLVTLFLWMDRWKITVPAAEELYPDSGDGGAATSVLMSSRRESAIHFLLRYPLRIGWFDSGLVSSRQHLFGL